MAFIAIEFPGYILGSEHLLHFETILDLLLIILSGVGSLIRVSLKYLQFSPQSADTATWKLLYDSLSAVSQVKHGLHTVLPWHLRTYTSIYTEC